MMGRPPNARPFDIYLNRPFFIGKASERGWSRKRVLGACKRRRKACLLAGLSRKDILRNRLDNPFMAFHAWKLILSLTAAEPCAIPEEKEDRIERMLELAAKRPDRRVA